MFLRRKILFTLVSSLVFLGIVGVVAFQFLKHSGIVSRPIQSSSQISNISFSFSNEDEAKQVLNDKGIIDEENVRNVNVQLVESVPEPMDIQVDDQGVMVISGAFTMNQKTANVYVAIGPYVQGLSDEEKKQWINSEFWRIAEFIARRNSKDPGKSLGSDLPQLFLVETKQ